MRTFKYFPLGTTIEEKLTSKASSVKDAVYDGPGTPPMAPRSVQATSGPRKVIITWDFPASIAGITGWRIYADTESKLVGIVSDVGTLKFEVDSTAGSTPPRRLFFVSAVNAGGRESAKIPVLGGTAAALVEASAPAEPTTPDEWNDERERRPTYWWKLYGPDGI